MSGYIAAIYDFRSKQDYIYRTNKVQEIMGASKLLEGAYQEAIAAYAPGKIDTSADDLDEEGRPKKFSLQGFATSPPQVEGIKLCEGGGNLTVLFKSEQAFKAFNNHFSLWLLENAPGLTPVCGSAEIDANGKFKEEMEKVFADLGKYKRLVPPLLSDTVLPITQIDRKTSQPVTWKGFDPDGKEVSLSEESVKKLDSYSDIWYWAEESSKHLTRHFDELITEKGRESLLAVIYVDGNGMGQRVQEYVNEDILFEDGVNKQRMLTQEIDAAFAKKPIAAIKAEIEVATGREDKLLRQIIGGGDEITIVCNARHGLIAANAYFKNLAASNPDFSACMGIAICHAHAPFAAVYEIAEQCCKSGKSKMKDEKLTNACFMDAHFCYSAITGELETLREQVGKERTCMPYNMAGEWTHFRALGETLASISRGDVKALRDAAFRSQADFEMELMRVQSNHKEALLINEKDRAMLCDACTFYDLWFRGEGNG
jgi:hypothetical protein